MPLDYKRYGHNFVNGKYVVPETDKFQEVVSPRDGKVLGKTPLSTAKDVRAAVEAAKAAFPAWSQLTVKKRMAPMLKLRNLIEQHESEFIKLVIEENGKNSNEAAGSTRKGNETVEYACGMPALMAGRCLEVSGGVECKDRKMPLGVVASVVPFNFPVMVPLWTAPIALATGNCFIVKPSEKVPSCAMLLGHLAKLAGFPDGVFQVVNGGIDAVNALCDDADIKALSFVGSTKVAKIVARRCASQDSPKRCLALGGAKNHLVAMPDCDIPMCAHDIVNSFAGSAGQRCMAAANLIIVGENQKLLDAIVAEAASRSTPFPDVRGTVGPVIDKAAEDRILGYINRAEKNGGKILLDGRTWKTTRPECKQGFWVGPTIILLPDTSDPCFHDEIFGPVLSVVRVDTKMEALKIENANPYGNAASIYTSSGDNAEWFSKHFSAGMIGVNIGVPVPREPFSFGGINQSKFGCSDITGDGGIEFFTQRKKITTKWRGNWSSFGESKESTKRQKTSVEEKD